MHNSESIFRELFLKKHDHNVSFGDESVIPIMGQGTVRASTVVNVEMKNIELQNFLFIPTLSCNLISVGKCRDNKS